VVELGQAGDEKTRLEPAGAAELSARRNLQTGPGRARSREPLRPQIPAPRQSRREVGNDSPGGWRRQAAENPCGLAPLRPCADSAAFPSSSSCFHRLPRMEFDNLV